jgi:hypothetical protein
VRHRRESVWSALGHREPSDADDWEIDERTNVFVPGLMGAGILLSGAILISDGVRRLLPSQGVRRRLNVVHGVRRIIVDLAEAAGMEIEERNLLRRERRTSWLYLLMSAVTLPLAFLVGRWGFNAYNSVGSSLEGNAMAIFYGMFVAVVLGAVGLVGITLWFPRLDPPRSVAWLVDRTALGRLTEPPDGVAERARLLIPNLDKGASS